MKRHRQWVVAKRCQASIPVIEPCSHERQNGGWRTMARMPEAFLFDLDGVLLDTEPLHAIAWRQAAAHFGMDLSDAQLAQLQGQRRLENARQVCSWIRQPISPEQLLAVRQPLAADLLSTAPAMPGAESLLRYIHSLNLPMALVTSSDRNSLQLKIRHHPWVNLLEVQVCGDDSALKAGKPAPDPYQLAALKLNVRPQDCWAFEDSDAGCQSARQAGCTVWRLMPTNALSASSPLEDITCIHALAEAERQLREIVQ